MIQELISIIKSANPYYVIHFEESSMMNIKVDEIDESESFCYIEEYTESRYFKEGYVKKKSTRVQIYFCKFTELHNDAIKRECLRSEIESEIVKPFMAKYNESTVFKKVDNFTCRSILPRFNANEISLMLEFDIIQTIC